MAARSIMVLALAGAGMAGCTTSSLPPTEVLRYHLGEPLARGTIAVQPLSGGAPASLEFKTYAAAVQGELMKAGYAAPAPGAKAQFVATVGFTRTTQAGPPRQSPISIGLGGGGFGGGRGGGVGLGGGVGFPIGGGGSSAILVSEIAVTIKRSIDQSPVWEGRAQAFADARKAEAGTDVQAAKIATALFTGFPGESGRTITVK